MRAPEILAAGVVMLAAFQAAPQVRSVVFVTGLQSPLAFVQDPGDRTVFFAVEQGGRIRVVRNRVVEQDFLDLRSVVSTGGERGLLGLALAPDFAASGRFFVNFTNTNGDTVVARFRRATPLAADPSSRFDLKWAPDGAAVIQQPFSNHNGGHLAFGPDGFLYIGLGDGGSGDDPQHRAQDPSSLLGKVLRIDVNVPDAHPSGYVVPQDNPFVDGAPVAARPEIWSVGLRNPWRFSFDTPALGGTGALVIGDVGQVSWEEIDYEPPGRGGRNYGWRNREGAHPNVESRPPAFQPLVDPIHEYGRNQGQSVTGGYVYRGRSLGDRLRGRYFFADFVSGRVWSVALAINSGSGEATAADLIEHTTDLGGASATGNISSFATDADGELYLVSHSRGVVLRLVGGLTVPGPLRIIR
ncbi:MAG: PQQ-dependent sugar dehydrogenase [Vicinamibacterales bacterium]